MKKIYFMALAALSLFSAQGQTDGCPGSNNITPTASCTNVAWSVPGTFTNGGSTISSCVLTDRDDGWFRFTASSSSTTITASASGQSIVLALYSGTSCSPANGSELSCTAIASGASGSITYSTTNGSTYLIQIHRTSGTNGADVSGNICVYNSPTASNGTCATAAALPCASGTINGTTVGATNTSSAGTGCSLGNVGAWYTFVGDGQQTTITSTAGSGYDHEMAIMSGSCGSLTNLSCNDNGLSGGSESSTFTTVNGTTYYVYISNYLSGSSTTGTFTISRTCTAAPVSGCTSAANLPCGTSNLAGTTVGVTSFPQNTGCSSSNYGTWYTFTGDGQSTTISATAGSGFDHKLIISSGNCNTMTNIACMDDSGSGGTESYTFTTVNGTTYYVYIAYYGSSGTAANTGTFTISRTCNAPPVSGCSNAVSLPCGTSNLSGTTVGASPAASGTGCLTSTYGSWYTFVGDGQQASVSSTAASGFDHEISIATGTCGSLTNVNCVDDAGSGGMETVVFSTTNGTTYYVYIAYYSSTGTAANTGAFTITKTCGQAGTGTSQDCDGSVQICNDQSFVGNSSGSGNTDLNSTNEGCASENQSSWYFFSPISAGTMAFQINTTVDYDFAIWGPFNTKQCPITVPPIRCSFAATYGNTGLSSSASDVSEGASGDKWVAPLVIGNTGINKYYIMLIDNFWATSTPFTIDFSLTNGLALNCTVLPVDLVHFLGYSKYNQNYLNWLTLSEHQSDYFIVEKSTDGANWSIVEKVKGKGNSDQQNSYTVIDKNVSPLENYYRLTQVDFDGTQHILNSTVIDNRASAGKGTLLYITNSLGQRVDENYKGLIFEVYSNGEIIKKIQ